MNAVCEHGIGISFLYVSVFSYFFVFVFMPLLFANVLYNNHCFLMFQGVQTMPRISFQTMNDEDTDVDERVFDVTCVDDY